MSLRVLIPLLLLVFSLLVTLIGYFAISSDLTEAIERRASYYMDIELNKFQSLYQPLLAKKDLKSILSLHASKASELDNIAMIVVAENGIVVASNNQQDLQQSWKKTRTPLDQELINKTINSKQKHTKFSNDRKKLNGYINLCVRDLSKGLRASSCGFLYYQLDVEYRQSSARAWLIKQSQYIAIGTGIVALLLMFMIHLKVTDRVLKIQNVLDLWSNGNRDAKIDLQGRDELNHIAVIINNLVSQFAKDEKALIFNKQVNDAIIQSANYSIITTDKNGIITSFNASAERLLGYSKEELINKETPGIVHDISEIIAHNKKLSIELGKEIKIGFETLTAKSCTGETDENNWTYIHKDGSRIPVRLSVTALYDPQNKIYGFLGIAHDISEQLKTEEQLEKLAYFDPLTKLPNRMLYSDRLEQAIVFAIRNKSKFSVFFIDLDKFKFVNDNYGHEVGDKLLIKVANILTRCVRKSDTVARLGGDEFTVILPNINSPYDRNSVSLIAEKIINQLNQDFIIDDNLVQIGASIGVAVYPDHGPDVSSLNKHADIAMYQAKDRGRGQHAFYDPLAGYSLPGTDLKT